MSFKYESESVVLVIQHAKRTRRIILPSVTSSSIPFLFHNISSTLRVSEQRNILHEIRKRKANWIGHILRRNCLVKHVVEGKIKGRIEVTRRRGRRRKQLLDDLGTEEGTLI
jgi:hypothetical protein